MGSRFFFCVLADSAAGALPRKHSTGSRPCTGPVLELPAVIAGRHLGGQEGGEVVLPEGSVNPSCLEETLDMPCRVFHESTVGGGVIYEIRRGFHIMR